MNRSRRDSLRLLAAGAALLLVVAAAVAAVRLHGAGQGAAAHPTATPTAALAASPSVPAPSVAARPAPTGTAPVPPARGFQALVVAPVSTPGVQGGSAYYLYDSATGRAARIPDQVGGLYGNLRFAPGGRLSVSSYSRIVSMARDGGSVRTEAAAPDKWTTIGDYAWSATGTLAYLLLDASSGSGSTGQLVVRAATGAVVRVPLGPVSTRLGGSAVRFSPDGGSLLVEAGTVQVRRLDGTLRWAAPDAPASDAVWTGDGRLYFWDSRGVNLADPATGATSTVLSGVRWFAPDAAPDGRRVVFEVRDPGDSRLLLLDTTSETVDPGFVRVHGRDGVFVSATALWLHEQSGPGAQLIGRDLRTGAERAVGLAGDLTDLR